MASNWRPSPNRRSCALKFEAAVAGGIPVIKALRESLLANSVSRVTGILNGTCNFILTKMQTEKRAFGDVLKEAQDKGYAEADPTFDIGGFDTAHKLALLTSLAFGTKVSIDDVYVEGIEGITSADIEAAEEMGYRIKLLGVAQKTPTGIEQRVHPTMVPIGSAIAEVSGVTNCVSIDADYVGALTLIGPGAGMKATASSVVSDIVDIARGDTDAAVRQVGGHTRRLPAGAADRARGRLLHPLFRVRPAGRLRGGGDADGGERRVAGIDHAEASPFDRRGRSLRKPTEAGAPTPAIMITHTTTEDAIRRALAKIEAEGAVAEKPQMIRIERV